MKLSFKSIIQKITPFYLDGPTYDHVTDPNTVADFLAQYSSIKIVGIPTRVSFVGFRRMINNPNAAIVKEYFTYCGLNTWQQYRMPMGHILTVTKDIRNAMTYFLMTDFAGTFDVKSYVKYAKDAYIADHPTVMWDYNSISSYYSMKGWYGWNLAHTIPTRQLQRIQHAVRKQIEQGTK